MKYILNNDNLEVVGKQYLQGVGGYDGTNTDGSEDVATVINDMPIVKGDAENSSVLKGGNNTVTAKYSAAIGYGNTVENNSSVAFGYNNKVKANCCFSDGSNNEVSGENSHVGGRECIVEGHESYAEGNYTKVYGHCSHGEGTSCRVLGDNSHVEGLSSVVYGHIGHAEGQYCAAGDLGQIEKPSSERTDAACHAEGIRTTAKEMASHSEGIDTHSMGVASHAEGRGSYTSGDASHAEGLNTKAGVKGFYFKGIDIKNKKIYLSTTKPDKIKTSGFSSSDFENIDFPYDIKADMLSIINGNIYYDCLKVTQIKNKSVIYVESLPFTSVAEFNELFKNSNYTIFCSSKYKLGAVSVSFGCHSEGYETRSFGFGSHSDGYNTIAKNVGEHASGIYNVSNSDTQFSIGIGTSEDDRKNAFEVKQNGDIYVEGVSGRIQDKLNSSNGGGQLLINITYSELKSLRDNSQLVPGQQYRIIDYVTTTTQSDTQSAGHQFDIIVTADDVNVLNENARAIQHEGDTYFSNSDLNAWELKYCLDNDTSRFTWADTENGKGVIYRMIDEWNNDCPYDFKNIQFKHPNDTEKYPDYYYTFSALISGVVQDYSFNGAYCYRNKIGLYASYGKKNLNSVVFINTSMIDYCHSNNFGNDCYKISFGYSCHSNNFDNSCHSNNFGDYCGSNSFGRSCNNNNFGDYCGSNSFGRSCNNNNFGNSCDNNNFGSSCNNNNFGRICNNNNFGNSCDNNNFGISCDNNNFGSSCNNNSFGDCCYNNSFGNDCYNNSFGESKDKLDSYYRYIIFDNGNGYINLNCTTTTSSSKYYQNVRIGLGVNNTTTFKTINDSNVGQKYQTIYKPTDSKDLTA